MRSGVGDSSLARIAMSSAWTRDVLNASVWPEPDRVARSPAARVVRLADGRSSTTSSAGCGDASSVTATTSATPVSDRATASASVIVAETQTKAGSAP